MKKIFPTMFCNKTQQSVRYLFLSMLILLLILATSCAHKISISPPLQQFDATEIPRIEKSVGYYISPDDLKKEVITPGGGGDKVKYLPYKESEPVLKTILSNIFINVYPVPSLNDNQFITSNNISYIFIPKIETNSSSRSMWIWPPSDFTVTLDCKAMDASGNEIWQKKIISEAHMGLPDVARDHSLAGKVAIKKAFSELQQEIISEEMFQ